MDLWIRSQNKISLIKAKELFISKHYGYYVITDYPMDYPNDDVNGGLNLGIYETKERALEVLDEIQKLLMPIVECTPIVEEDVKPEYTYKHYVNCGSNTKVIQLNTYVYEMPSE